MSATLGHSKLVNGIAVTRMTAEDGTWARTVVSDVASRGGMAFAIEGNTIRISHIADDAAEHEYLELDGDDDDAIVIVTLLDVIHRLTGVRGKFSADPFRGGLAPSESDA